MSRRDGRQRKNLGQQVVALVRGRERAHQVNMDRQNRENIKWQAVIAAGLGTLTGFTLAELVCNISMHPQLDEAVTVKLVHEGGKRPLTAVRRMGR